jgi:CTP:molybdopterin cytidylyltransferase MocA
MTESALAGLLLAAGGSERLGQAKQLVNLQGETLVQKAATLLLDVASEVVVVTGAYAPDVTREMKDMPVRTVHNIKWHAGMGGSIAAGMNALGVEPEGVLILLCDQWRITGKDLESLCRAWKAEPELVAAANWGTGYGAPAIFPRNLFTALSRLDSGQGAKGVIGQQEIVRLIDMSNARYDLDTPEDLLSLRQFGIG